MSKNTADHKLFNFKLKSKVKEILSYSQSIQDSLNSILARLLFHLGLHPTSRGLQSFETWGWGWGWGVCICACVNMEPWVLPPLQGPWIWCPLRLHPHHSGRSGYAYPLFNVTLVLFMKVRDKPTSPLCHSGTRGPSQPLCLDLHSLLSLMSSHHMGTLGTQWYLVQLYKGRQTVGRSAPALKAPHSNEVCFVPQTPNFYLCNSRVMVLNLVCTSDSP